VLRDNEAENFAGNWQSKVFENSLPVHLEVGTGFGHFMQEYCLKNREVNFVGMDYRFKRSFQLAKKLERLGLDNIRYLRARGERLGHLFAESELEALHYYFPDPWPKNRHKKKRLFQAPFLNMVKSTVRNGGRFYIKTDHYELFTFMLKQLEGFDCFEVHLQTRDLWGEAPSHFLASFQTKFEKIFLSQGTKINAMELEVRK